MMIEPSAANALLKYIPEVLPDLLGWRKPLLANATTKSYTATQLTVERFPGR